MMKLGILGAGMIVREFLPWLTGPESPFKVEALCRAETLAPADFVRLSAALDKEARHA